jgi:hypothetical protein
MVTKSSVKEEEIPEFFFEGEEDQTMNNADLGFVCDDKDFNSCFKEFNCYDNDKDFNSYIEEQNSRIALLSCNVDEILSNIDSIVQKKREDGGY